MAVVVHKSGRYLTDFPNGSPDLTSHTISSTGSCRPSTSSAGLESFFTVLESTTSRSPNFPSTTPFGGPARPLLAARPVTGAKPGTRRGGTTDVIRHIWRPLEPAQTITPPSV